MSWIEINKSISKSFEFENYSQSIDFINSVAVLAEKEKSSSQYFNWIL